MLIFTVQSYCSLTSFFFYCDEKGKEAKSDVDEREC